MSWKLLLGRIIHKIDQTILQFDLGFVKRHYPYRRDLMFDLKRSLPEPKVIFDVGAYIGEISLAFNKSFKNANIYSFEPVSASFAKMQKAVDGVSNIKIYPFAIGEKDETLVIPLYEEMTIATLKEADYDIDPVSSETINVITLHNFLSSNNIKKIDILKIDVEGYEFEVLKGLGEYLQYVNCIITEVGYIRCATKSHFADMDKFMEDNGFYLFNIYELMPVYNDSKQLSYSNNVYLKKNDSEI